MSHQSSDKPEDSARPSGIPSNTFFGSVLVIIVGAWVGFESLFRAYTGPGYGLDHIGVESLRLKSDPSRMIGPHILEEAMRDFTAMGGYAVLSLTIISFTMFLVLQHGNYSAKFFLFTTIGGYICSMLMKKLVGRDRPAFIPHLSYVDTSSFPSSHSMMSVIVFLTIGILLARQCSDKRVRRMLLLLPIAVAWLVGISRVCMGVHFPTDVLAGWSAGVLWIWAAFAVYDKSL